MKNESNKVIPFKVISVPTDKLHLYESQMSLFGYYPNNRTSHSGTATYLKYKGELFLMIRAYEQIHANPTKYLAYKKLKDFIGHKRRENKELIPYFNSLSNTLSSHTLRSHMTNALKESKITSRISLYLLNADLSPSSRVTTIYSDYSNLRQELEYAWGNTKTGRKANDRKYSSIPQERRKRIYGDIFSTMVGGVHTEAGIYLRAYKEKMSRVLDFNKKPMTLERHYGIELEFYIPFDNFDDFKKDLATSQYANCLTLGNDGSLSNMSGHYDKELKICVPHSKMHSCVIFVSETMNKYSCKVDAKCGMHVHLDARKEVGDIMSMFNNLISQQAGLMELVPEARRNNNYCKRTKRTDYLKGSRYKSINSLSFKKFQTLEVRLHGGTTDAVKIINWITLISSIAYNSEVIAPSRSARTMLTKLPLPLDAVAFFKQRIELFKKAA